MSVSPNTVRNHQRANETILLQLCLHGGQFNLLPQNIGLRDL